MTSKNPYESFENYLLRIPVFSFSFYENLTSESKVSDDHFKRLCKSPIIREALFIASPVVLHTADKWLTNKLKDEKKIERLKNTIFKYLTRMSSRATPFGLFSGVSFGRVSDGTNIELEKEYIAKNTRLDMDYLIQLSSGLVKNEKVKKQLNFFANTSIYRIGERYRYIEFIYIGKKRQYRIAEVGYSEYLKQILSKSRKGVLLEELITDLVDEDISLADARHYIDELIYNQILTSEIEPSISGKDYLNQICSALRRIDGIEDIKLILEKVDEKIKRLNSETVSSIKDYFSIEETIKPLGINYDLKHLFQTDMTMNLKENFLSKEIVKKVKKGITFLNMLSGIGGNSRLNSFRDAFYKRFEGREIPLTRALDVELGIMYGQNKNFDNINPLLDDINFPYVTKKTAERKVNWSPAQAIFQNKLLEAYKNNDYIIRLNEEDFDDSQINWENLPDTMSCFIQLIEHKGVTKIKLKVVGNSSAANLLGRFSYYNEELHQYINRIADVESRINRDKIIAEVVHLPEDRVGNVLMHPDFREFEIPVITKSNKPMEKQIPIDDLAISVRNNNRLFLRSKKNNKEVLPRITNAHNFHGKLSLPIYQFLADMQTQNKRDSISFYLGDVLSRVEFIPRIEFEDIILQSATWHLKTSNVQPLVDIMNSEAGLRKEIKAFRKKYNIPKYIYYAEGENELLINLDNITSVQLLLGIVSKKNSFKITEFLFDDSTPVKGDAAYFINEIVLGFYNKEKLTKSNVNE